MAHTRHSLVNPQTHASHMSPRFDRLIGLQLQQWEHAQMTRKALATPIGDTAVHHAVACPLLGYIFEQPPVAYRRYDLRSLLMRRRRLIIARI